MKPITTLTEFLESGGIVLAFSDMGRRITDIAREAFIDFELTDAPYPLPLQRQAWFALTISDPGDRQIDPMIWFIRFPLDEQGKLQQAARDGFMYLLVENLGKNLQAGENEARMQTALQDNPYAFQPKPERLAALHARMTAALGNPASRFYDHAKAYFDGKPGWEQWSFIGYQGIADLAARVGQDDNAERIAASIPQLPPPPLEAICHCLENEAIPVNIAQALADRAMRTLEQPSADPQVLTALVRGISQSASPAIRDDLILRLLEHPVSSRTDILAAIAGRAWECLTDASLRGRYLERLAVNESGQDFFNRILSDLLFLPITRVPLQAGLREAQRSAVLSNAIGEFFTAVREA